MSLRRRRIAAIALVAASPLVLSACGTSFSAQTNQQYQQSIGANLRDTDAPVQIYNGLFVDNGDGTATFSGALLARAEDQVVESVEVTSSGTDVNASPSGTPTLVDLPNGIELTAELLAPVGADGEIIVEDDEVVEGRYALVTLNLSSGQQVSLNVPVVARSEMYSSVATESQTPSPEQLAELEAADLESTE
ncbi:hypothetical protein JL108_02910 [Aeromicrobium sp. YIM 150415]|uniref:hypothetical protein n=1 Tax=Aeromicrobium sp. YIM 150415 TaxID=2803912 RepID=UPI001965F061|nr:hypothetical protein [Aeromicrobium sp. YIM 150415]MBM9462383.1 hypothetical protein [Aeromicrobium sp. YIM 150415]